MKKVVIATLLAGCAVAVLFLFRGQADRTQAAHAQPDRVQPDILAAEASSAVKAVVKASAQTGPAADMSLPLPLGLKGDPEKGKIFFMTNCFTCHGVDGDGNGPRAYFITPPPRNFLLEASRQRLNRPTLFEAIANGRLGTNMPAWGKVLTLQEIADVAEFVFQNFISAPQANLPQVNSPQVNQGISK